MALLTRIALGNCLFIFPLVIFSPAIAQNCVISGGVNIGTINQNCIVAPRRLEFRTDIAEEIIRRMPEGKPVEIRAVGSSGDWYVASQYHDYLRNKGFSVSQMNIGMIAPPPEAPLTIEMAPNRTVLTISPRTY